MKEFVMKHPVVTLLGVGCLVDGVVKVVKLITLAIMVNKNSANETIEATVEEEKNNEPAGDIQ